MWDVGFGDDDGSSCVALVDELFRIPSRSIRRHRWQWQIETHRSVLSGWLVGPGGEPNRSIISGNVDCAYSRVTK